MHQSIKKITRYICLFVGVIFLSNTPVVLANDKSPYYLKPLIWKGKITIKRIGSAGYKKNKNTVSKTTHSSMHRELKDTVTIEACGEPRELFIKDVTRTYVYNHKKTFIEKYSLAHCPLPPEAMEHNILYRTKHYPPSIRKPGNSRKLNETTIKNIYTSKDCLSPKEMTKVFLLVFPDGKYSLSANSKVYTTTKEFITDKEKLVCNNDRKVHRVDIHTCGFDEKEETIIGEEFISSKIHPKLLSLTAIVSGRVQNNSIKGSKCLSEIKPKFKGDYKEVYSASWDFKAKDPCEIVYNSLMLDLAYAEAFSDKKIQDFADSINEYKELIDTRAKKIYKTTQKGRSGSHGGDGVETESDMSVNIECKIVKKDEFKNKVAQQCWPKIIYKAALTHEERHVDQCEKFKEEFILGAKKDPRIHGLMEVTAYLGGIKKLFYWLKDNCEDYDLADAKLRIKNIQAMKFKRE